jgi:DNA-binding transcriptional LysR family regulator
LLAALRAGVGIDGRQTGIAARTPEPVRLLLAEIAFTRQMWLVMHQHLKATRRVRLLFDFLRGALGEYCAGIGNG